MKNCHISGLCSGAIRIWRMAMPFPPACTRASKRVSREPVAGWQITSQRPKRFHTILENSGDTHGQKPTSSSSHLSLDPTPTQKKETHPLCLSSFHPCSPPTSCTPLPDLFDHPSLAQAPFELPTLLYVSFVSPDRSNSWR